MTVIVRVLGAADGTTTPHDDRWVKSWDPHTEAGTLALTSTGDPEQARRWPTPVAVFVEWKTVSRVQPVRPWDSAPNRPLSGISISLDPYPLPPTPIPASPSRVEPACPRPEATEPSPPPTSAGRQARPPTPRAEGPRRHPLDASARRPRNRRAPSYRRPSMAQSTTSTSSSPETLRVSAGPTSSSAPSTPPVTLDDVKASATELAAEAASLCSLVLAHAHRLSEADLAKCDKTLKGLTSDIHEASHPLQQLAEPAEAPPVHQPS